MKKIKSTNIFLVIVAVVCLVGIITLAFILIFSSVRPSLDKCEYQYHLQPGIYEVGTHLPAGKYFVQSYTEETCAFEVGKITDGYLGINAYYEVRDNTDLMSPTKGMWKVELKNRKKYLTLDEGELLILRPNQELLFFSRNLDVDTLDSIQNNNSNYYFASDYEYSLSKTSVSGTDFEPGVYDIVYTPTNPNHSGNISCIIRFNGLFESEYTMTFTCKGKDGPQIVYKNIPFTANSTISVTNIQNVELVPSKYISEIFDDVTSN